MDLIERTIYMLIGGFVGFILGYIVANLRTIKEEVDEIDEIVKENWKHRDDAGEARPSLINRAFYFLVLVIVVWAAFSSQKASNEVQRTSECTQDFLVETINALNERTTYSGEQARANVELQSSQAQFLSILLEDPPPDDDRVRESLREYYTSLSEYVDVNGKTRIKVANNPYPTVEGYQNCIEK